PLTATITSEKPTARLLGTGTTICVDVHELGTTEIPPNVTALLPCVAPKFVPLIVTGPPTGLTGPTDGDILVIVGAVCPRVRISENSSSNMILGIMLVRAFIFFVVSFGTPNLCCGKDFNLKFA